jgi:hypothetical protein
MRRWTLARWALVAIGAAAAVALVMALITVLTDEPAPTITLVRPQPGEARADYLPDGTPVWVIGHDDATVSVISGFDTHTPLFLNKLNWWCPQADALENPAHGSHWDEYGNKLGGPAPTGLPTWEATVVGGRVVLGELRPGAPPDAPFFGDAEADRDWCTPPDDDVVVHRFEDWPIWRSPTDAVASAPDGWILLEGTFTPDGGVVRLCAVSGCEDSVVATGLEVPTPQLMELGNPYAGTRWLARVRDGALVDVTRLAFDPAG